MVVDRVAAKGKRTRQILGMAKHRWIIQRDYEELKQELGLGHFEGRNWRGFHHHATLCIAAYGFLVAERNLFFPSARTGLPPARLTAFAPSDIIRIRSQRYTSSSHVRCCGNCITVLFVGRARDDPPRQVANDSELCAKHRPLTSPCRVFPVQHNASLQASPPGGVHSGFPRRTESRVRAAVPVDSGPIGGGKTV